MEGEANNCYNTTVQYKVLFKGGKNFRKGVVIKRKISNYDNEVVDITLMAIRKDLTPVFKFSMTRTREKCKTLEDSRIAEREIH